VLPAGLGDASVDPNTSLGVAAFQRGAHDWLEPIPDARVFETPETALAARQSVRLAVMTAL
jgi:RNA polymerase sigma-70 factor (ECF subfamily)